MHEANLAHQEIPVLMYHRVVDAPLTDSIYNVYVSKDVLAKQIRYYQKRGFELVTFADLKARFVKKPMVLTFDDGYQDNYQNLLPLLYQYGAKAVIFALANREVDANYWDIKAGEPKAALMNDGELRECVQSKLVEIGSHGLNHTHLTTLTDDELSHEIKQSKSTLEHIIATGVCSFAYPYGDFDKRAQQAVNNAGYCFGVATSRGSAIFADDLSAIRRIPIFPNESRFSLWKKTSGYYLRYLKLKGK